MKKADSYWTHANKHIAMERTMLTHKSFQIPEGSGREKMQMPQCCL